MVPFLAFIIAEIIRDLFKKKLGFVPCKVKQPLQSQNKERNCQNQLGHPGLSYIEQECQVSLIQRKVHNQQNLNEGPKHLYV